MSGFFANLWNKAFPDKVEEYPAYILEAAELEECDPEEIMWCETCNDWHMSYYG